MREFYIFDKNQINIPMSQFLKFIFLIASIGMSSCAVNSQFSSKWEEDINFNSEIYSKTEAIYYHPKDAISIKIFNNKQYIDIILETNSANTLRKIYNLGLSIWIDSKGKLQNSYAVNFPMPSQFPYTTKSFENYLSRFSMIEFNEELFDRFQTYEVLNTNTNENISMNTLQPEDNFQLKLSSKEEVLFSYHLRIQRTELFTEKINGTENISIGIASINEANEAYFSTMSSKEYINKRMDKLKAGTDQNPHELAEWWVDFKLTSK